MSEQVHWHEGLFLQPHHLQAMQRQLHDRFALERRLAWSHPYGLVEAKLSPDALENHTVRFDRLHVVMPSGLVVNVPDTADLPPLDIKRAFEGGSQPFVVRLGVPNWYPTRGNAIDVDANGDGGGADWRMKRVFRVREVQRTDENTGENPQPVLLRRTNARLLLDGDDATDLEVLPLLRIAHATGQDVGLPRQDPTFVPPCLLLSGSVLLRDLVRDLANQLQASRKELASQIVRGQFQVEAMRGAQFEQVLRLRTLNRAAARLPHIAEVPGVTPFQVYLELRELLAELAALHPERDTFDVPDYDHDNPAVAFTELNAKIRPHLKGMVKGRFAQLPFGKDASGKVLYTKVTEQHLTEPTDYFLGIKSREDARGVAALVEDPDKFKLMALSMIRNAVRGVRLQEERQPPLELPSQAGLTYFRLLRSESTRMWEQVKADKGMAIRWPELEQSDFQVALFMTLAG